MARKEKLKPSYKKGYLSVGDGHELYYELYGNPKGVPIIFFHGGPGSGFSDKHKVYFDPEKHHIIFLTKGVPVKVVPLRL